MAATFNPACVVSIRQHGSGRDTQADEGSCCGILLDTQRGTVLTHASCLAPFIEKNHLDLTSFLPSVWSQGVTCEVLLQKENVCGDLDKGRLSQTQVSTSISQIPYHQTTQGVRKVNRNKTFYVYSKFTAKLTDFFYCPEVKESLKMLMPEPAWELLDKRDTNEGNSNRNGSKKAPNEEALHGLLSSFLVLKLQNWRPYSSSLTIRSTKDCHIGDTVEIWSTPFGGLKPDAFMNSYSRGVVSNLAGNDRCLLLSDARCILGGEGAPLYTVQPGVGASSRSLTAIVIASLCWKNEEWVGFCIACDIATVLSSVPAQRQVLLPGGGRTMLVPTARDSLPLQGVQCPEVVLLSVGSSWGSGVLVDAQSGLLLTCSHVIKEAHLYPVQAKRKPHGPLENTKVIFRQHPLRHQFDLAVVQLSARSQSSAGPGLPLSVASPVEGMDVFVVGHALFGAEHNLQPSVTSGVISKVIRINNTPVMIQTTCAVHPGASGGALLDTRGRLLAIVVCNARDNSSGASFPHINMSVPVCTVWPHIAQYIRTQDTGHLDRLTAKNSVLDTVWSLGATQGMELVPISSRL